MADSLRQSIRDYFTEIVRLEESLECLRRVMKEKDRDDYLDVFNEIRANNDEIGLQRENFVSFFRYGCPLTLGIMEYAMLGTA